MYKVGLTRQRVTFTVQKRILRTATMTSGAAAPVDDVTEFLSSQHTQLANFVKKGYHFCNLP